MRHPAPLILLASCLLLTAPARAQRGPLEPLLEAADDGPGLRARLVAHADSVAARDAVAAAQALAYAGLSFARGGEPDSAVACYERALALDGGLRPRMDLAQALTMRIGKGDAERAREVLRPVQPILPELPNVGEAAQQGLFAWSHYLAGEADSAARLFAPVENWLSVSQEWRYRMACVALARGEWIRVMVLLTPLAVASRTSDRDVMEMMSLAAEKLNVASRLTPMLLQEIALRDNIEQELLTDLGARRVSFTAPDGFPLGGVLLAPRAARARAAVVLVAPGDTLALYDSLAVGLRRMGFATLLLETRGSGRSVAPGCPLPDSWRGREAQMHEVVAGDVRAAVAALAREARADSTRYLVVGVGRTTPIAVHAAWLDRRAQVLMLVSPTPSPVDRGPMRAVLAALKRPVYFQSAPADNATWGLIDVLYRACDMRASRVADSDTWGTQAALFREDPKILARFRQWLAGSWPRSPAPSATPPSRRRKG